MINSNRTYFSKLILLLALALAMALTLAGCGFALRGNNTLSESLPEVQLNLQQPNTEMSRLIRRTLESSGIVVSESREGTFRSGVPVLSVGAEQLEVRPITVTPRARAAQYEIRISIQISLNDGNAAVFGPEDLTVDQTYYENTANITGTQEEIELIQGEMRRQLVNQLVRRLEAATRR